MINPAKGHIYIGHILMINVTINVIVHKMLAILPMPSPLPTSDNLAYCFYIP
jgi:hypothetical protein